MRTTRLHLLAALVLACLGAAGCSTAEEEAKAQRMMSQPEIAVIGTFDGCEVKFVNRYYRDRSFYLARCGDTATTTQQFTEQHGRATAEHTRIAITQRLSALDEERTRLEKELTAIDQVRQSAMSKLTAQERAALGVEQ